MGFDYKNPAARRERGRSLPAKASIRTGSHSKLAVTRKGIESRKSVSDIFSAYRSHRAVRGAQHPGVWRRHRKISWR